MSLKGKKREEEETTAAPASSSEPVAEEKPTSPKAAEKKLAPVPGSKITFGMYCSLKKIPERHRPGMRAFTKVKSATLPEWDKVFEKY